MRHFIRWTMILLVGLVACSCQSTGGLGDPLAVPKVTPASTTGGRDSAELAYELSGKTWCSNDEACSMVLLLMDGVDNYQSFDDRVAVLQQRGWVGQNWNLQADEAVTKGALSYMICQAQDVKGGVMMHLIPSRRYAYREALELKWVARGSEYEPLTGPEVVGIMGRVGRMNDNRQ